MRKKKSESAPILVVVFCQYGFLSRFIGLLFIILLIIYLKVLLNKKKFNATEIEQNSNVIYLLILIVLSSIMLYLGTESFIKGAKGIADLLGMNSTVIGLTIIALGTSAPELSTSFIAVKKNEYDMIMRYNFTLRTHNLFLDERT